MGSRNSFVKFWNYAMGTLLLIIAAGSFSTAWGALGNLFEDYQDSPASTYLIFGLPFVAIGIAAAIGGVMAFRLNTKAEE